MIGLFVYLLAVLCATAAALSLEKPSPPVLQSRTTNGGSSSDAWHAVRRAIASSSLGPRSKTKSNSTTLDASWTDATLFSWTEEQTVDAKKGSTKVTQSVEIICTTCYIKGVASAEFTVEAGFNATRAFRNATRQIGNEIDDLVTEVIDYVEEYLDETVENITSDGIDLDDFDLPPLDVDFDLDLPEIPECGISFTFEDLELYVQLATKLSAGVTYTLNLYTSNTPIGFSVGNTMQIGVVFSVDLIISVNGEIEISNGFHIKVDEVAMQIAMFGKNISDMKMDGGEFEFLPVTIESAGVVFQAVLRLGVTAGFDVASPDISVKGVDVLKAGAGVEVGVFAKIADFVANITMSEDEDSECPVQVEQSFQLAVGAAAGATLAVGEYTWGPMPNTEVPVFYTTMAPLCPSSPTSTSSHEAATHSAELEERADKSEDDITTSTLKSKVVYVATVCLSSGLVNCPVSLQSTVKTTTTTTIVTTIEPSGSTSSPGAKKTSQLPIDFGRDANKMTALSGSPTSYVPPPVSTTSLAEATTSAESKAESGDESSDEGETNNRNKIIIGVSVGVGSTLVIAAAILFFIIRRRRTKFLKETEE